MADQHAETKRGSFEPPIVGNAYRCPDGIVRWVTHLSVRGYYHLLWLDEERNQWHQGGKVKARDWQGGEPYPAPQPGDTYTLLNAFGYPDEWWVPTIDAAGEVQP
jgi:hypothetical protein